MKKFEQLSLMCISLVPILHPLLREVGLAINDVIPDSAEVSGYRLPSNRDLALS